MHVLENKGKKEWELIHKKYKANKSTKTQVTKEHNNQDITNTLKKNISHSKFMVRV